MDLPILPATPALPEPETFEDREGCEFIDGEWVPKHPDRAIELYHDRKGCEYIDDCWVEKNMSAEADLVGGRLLSVLLPFVDDRDLGLVFGSECGYQIFPDKPLRVRKPDVSFVAAGRLQDDRPPRGNVPIAPDLAVEVNSPSDLAENVNAKVVQYLGAGVRLVWVIFPLTKSAWVFRANGTANWIGPAGALDGEDVISGFGVKLEALLKNL